MYIVVYIIYLLYMYYLVKFKGVGNCEMMKKKIVVGVKR